MFGVCLDNYTADGQDLFMNGFASIAVLLQLESSFSFTADSTESLRKFIFLHLVTLFQ